MILDICYEPIIDLHHFFILIYKKYNVYILKMIADSNSGKIACDPQFYLMIYFALKGQSKIVDQLRKSYSMNDLSPDGLSQPRRTSTSQDSDDELGKSDWIDVSS